MQNFKYKPDFRHSAMTDEQRKTVAPALFILADRDPISDGSLKYEEALHNNGVVTVVKKYDGSMRGFIEENNPEYEKLHGKVSPLNRKSWHERPKTISVIG